MNCAAKTSERSLIRGTELRILSGKGDSRVGAGDTRGGVALARWEGFKELRGQRK